MRFYLNQREHETLFEIVRQGDGASKLAIEKALAMSHSQAHYAIAGLHKKGLITIVRIEKNKGPATHFYGLTRKGRAYIEKAARAVIEIANMAGVEI